VFLLEEFAVSKLQRMFEVQPFGLERVHNRFATRLLPCR